MRSKILRKKIVIGVVAAMMLSLAACGKDSDQDKTTATTTISAVEDTSQDIMVQTDDTSEQISTDDITETGTDETSTDETSTDDNSGKTDTADDTSETGTQAEAGQCVGGVPCGYRRRRQGGRGKGA